MVLVRRDWKMVKEIKELLSLRVGTSGGSLVLGIPKALAEQYDIDQGDRIKVQLRELFKEVKSPDPK